MVLWIGVASKKGQFNAKSNTILNAKIKAKLHSADAFEIDFLLFNSAAQLGNAIPLGCALRYIRLNHEIVVHLHAFKFGLTLEMDFLAFLCSFMVEADGLRASSELIFHLAKVLKHFVITFCRLRRRSKPYVLLVNGIL